MPRPPLFPSTTLFRSLDGGRQHRQRLAVEVVELGGEAEQPGDPPAQVGDRARAHAPSTPVTVKVPAAGSHSADTRPAGESPRSEEHTSELQSRLHLVCRDLHSFPPRRSSDLWMVAASTDSVWRSR